MTITRSNLEILLLNRVKAMFVASALDFTTNTGDNPDLNDPIGFAIRWCNGTTVDVAEVSDVDVATVGNSRLDELLDVAELRALQNAFGNYSAVGLKIGPRSEYQDQLAVRLRARIKDMEKDLGNRYGYGIVEAEVGTISLDFAQHDTE